MKQKKENEKPLIREVREKCSARRKSYSREIDLIEYLSQVQKTEGRKRKMENAVCCLCLWSENETVISTWYYCGKTACNETIGLIRINIWSQPILSRSHPSLYL